ncbi:MAG: hypothetical protein ACREYC_26160 [Gammaproteobacteria bacterium]
MSIPQSVAGILQRHVTLEIEGIDRMYLNVYVPQLQREGTSATKITHSFRNDRLLDQLIFT